MEVGYRGSESYYPVSGKDRQVDLSAEGRVDNHRDGSLSFMSEGREPLL